MTDCKSKVKSNFKKEGDTEAVKNQVRGKYVDEFDRRLRDIKKILDKTPDIDPVQKKRILDSAYDDYKKWVHDDLRQDVVNAKSLAQFTGIMENPNLPTPKDKMDFLLNQTNRLKISKERIYQAALINPVEEMGLLDVLKDKQNHIDVIQEMIQIRESGGNPGITKNAPAKELAQQFRKWLNSVRQDVVAAGAPLGFVDGYVPRKWLPEKFIDVSDNDFINKFYPALDKSKFPAEFSEKDYIKYLKEFKNKIELKENAEFNPFIQETPKNTLDRLLYSRGIPLKPEYEASLIQEFAETDIYNTLLTYGSSMAKRLAIMDGYGASAETGFKNYADLMIQKSTTEGKSDVIRQMIKAKESFDYFVNPYKLGSGDSKMAKGFELFRAGTAGVSLKMSSAVKSLVMDSASVGAFANAYQNKNLLSGVATYYKTLFDSVTMNKEQKSKLAEALGYMHRLSVEEEVERIGLSGKLTGWAGKGVNLLHKTTMMPLQQTFSQRATRLIGSMHLAELTSKKFNELDPANKGYLQMFGISEADLKALQTKVTKIGNLDIVDEGALLMSATKEDKVLWSKVTKYLNKTEASIGIPGPIENSVFKSGNPDSIVGQLWRTAGMFKTFPMVMMKNIKDIKNFNPGTEVEYLNNFARYKGNYANVAWTMAGMMTAGYATVILSDLMKNKTPQTEMNLDLMSRVIMSSGTLGLYGDVLLSDLGTYGRGILDALEGPGLQAIEEGVAAMYSIGNEIIDPEKEVKATKAIKFFVDRAPIGKPMLDSLLWEALDPEYAMKRYEKEQRAMEERGQNPVF